MSKKAKAQAKEKRLKKKRATKAAQPAKYEAWTLEGKNKKSKRTRIARGRVKAVKSRNHPNGYCGNIGCIRCNESFNNPWRVNSQSCIYGKRWTSSKWSQFEHLKN